MYSVDKTAGEAKIFCDACEQCRFESVYTKNKDMWKQECEEYIVTNEHSERLRKKIKVVKK